jgi:hypothetical protein
MITDEAPTYISRRFSTNSHYINLSAGMLAGCVNGIIMNPATRCMTLIHLRIFNNLTILVLLLTSLPKGKVSLLGSTRVWK